MKFLTKGELAGSFYKIDRTRDVNGSLRVARRGCAD